MADLNHSDSGDYDPHGPRMFDSVPPRPGVTPQTPRPCWVRLLVVGVVVVSALIGGVVAWLHIH